MRTDDSGKHKSIWMRVDLLKHPLIIDSLRVVHSSVPPSLARPPPRSNEKAVDSLVVWSVGQFRLFKSSLELDGKLLSPLVRFVKWDFAMFDRQQR